MTRNLRECLLTVLLGVPAGLALIWIWNLRMGV